MRFDAILQARNVEFLSALTTPTVSAPTALVESDSASLGQPPETHALGISNYPDAVPQPILLRFATCSDPPRTPEIFASGCRSTPIRYFTSNLTV